MNWLLLAILTAIFFGAYNVLIKVSSGHINQIVGAVILQAVAALVGVIILIFLKMIHMPLVISQKGIWYAVGAGVMIGLAEITAFFLYSKGIPASVGIPIIVSGSIVVGAALGVIFLKEYLTPLQYLAIAMTIAGAVILSMK